MTPEQAKILQDNVKRNAKNGVITPMPVSCEKRTKHKSQPEYHLQVAVTQYLRSQYPKIYFMSDTVAQVHLTDPQKRRNQSIQDSKFHCPDIIIFETRSGFGGLFLELKSETPWKKNGEIKASDKDHLKKQLETINTLVKKGYVATFVWSYEMAKTVIDNYLKP